jgi:GNAT superfamily N-acetyltransferase
MDTTLFSVAGCCVAYLRPDDTAALQALLERSADYSELVTGAPPGPSEALSLLQDCPEGKTTDDKVVIGFFTDQGHLVGVLDAVRDYPGPRVWFLGLLLLDPDYRNKGLGERTYRAFERWAGQQGARRIRVGVVEANQRAYAFWERMGFAPAERRPPRRYGNLEHVVIVMERAVGG